MQAGVHQNLGQGLQQAQALLGIKAEQQFQAQQMLQQEQEQALQ